jgi:hypothetical protein
MGPHDEETERYLKEFQPQAIRELQVAPLPRTISWRRLAAAAAVAACVGGIFWFSRRESTRWIRGTNTKAPTVIVVSEPPHPSILALTTLALQDKKKFDALLDEESRKSLPRFQEEHSALKVLAKD